MTRIDDVLATAAAAGRPTLSFEFFPPKTPEAEAQLRATLDELEPLRPDFISVTYGALGSTRERTRDLVIEFGRRFAFPVMAHLTCVGHTRAEVDELLDAYAAAGIENILALGGDPPADGTDPGGEFTYAIELVDQVRARGRFSIGVAAHPELHPRSGGDREADRRHLVDKLARADFGITQFFFDVEPYLRMRDELAALGCDTPVVPGVMPFLAVAGARRMAAMNGAAIPPALDARLDAVDGDPAAVRALGVEVALDLAEKLLVEGAPGLHLYALNRSASVREIVAGLGLRP